MDTENLAQSVKDYILQLEAQLKDYKFRYEECAIDANELHAQVAELQSENADLRDELEMFNHTPNF